MIFRRKNHDRANPSDLLQRLRSLHDLLDTTQETGADRPAESSRRPPFDAGPADRLVALTDARRPFDDDVPMLVDVVAPEELPEAALLPDPEPPHGRTQPRLRALTTDAEVMRALAAFELAVSRHLGNEFDAARNQEMRSEIRRSLTRMLSELETRWKDR